MTGCIRQYRKQQHVVHHQPQASAPAINVTLNMQGGFQQTQPQQR